MKTREFGENGFRFAVPRLKILSNDMITSKMRQTAQPPLQTAGGDLTSTSAGAGEMVVRLT
jgi:hypothetical protein